MRPPGEGTGGAEMPAGDTSNPANTFPGSRRWGGDSPVAVKGLFQPHYVSWSEQLRIEAAGRATSATSFASSRRPGFGSTRTDADEEGPGRSAEQRRLISDSKTPNGVADVPLTDFAVDALRDQMQVAGNRPYLFPSDDNHTGHQTTFKTAWRLTLRRANVPYFRIYDLRSTYAPRLRAGGSLMNG